MRKVFEVAHKQRGGYVAMRFSCHVHRYDTFTLRQMLEIIFRSTRFECTVGIGLEAGIYKIIDRRRDT